MTTILHTYSEKNLKYQVNTLAAVDWLRKKSFQVTSRLTTVEDDESYWKVLMDYWGEDDLIHFQQDIVPTVAKIESLLDCSYPLCTYPHKLENSYGLWWGEWDESVPQNLANGIGPLNPTAMHWYKQPFPMFAQGSGIALVKINQEIQEAIPLADIPNRHWSTLDLWISSYIARKLDRRWHVHTPPVLHSRMEY